MKRENHGMSNRPEYQVWADMKTRCKNPKHAWYESYGGRGIKVCKRWERFTNFLRDMGFRPSDKHTLGRIDNSGDYEPDNCHWETSLQQQNNTRLNRVVLFNGVSHSLSDWARILGLPRSCFTYRLSHWTIERAFSTPLMNRFGKGFRAGGAVSGGREPENLPKANCGSLDGLPERH